MPKGNHHKLILDLCGGTGAWSKPYRDAGYDVRVIDLPNDVRLLEKQDITVHGILAAPPCTRFSFARNRYPATPEELKDALSIVDACLRAVFIYRPQFWALENPRAKLRRYLGPARMDFYQWQFGDPGHKPTCIWGDFNLPTKSGGTRTKPSTWNTKKPNATKRDQITPPGFARAFFKANP
jgi:hypothetical protein